MYFYLIHQSAKTGSKNDPYLRIKFCYTPNEIRSCFYYL